MKKIPSTYFIFIAFLIILFLSCVIFFVTNLLSEFYNTNSFEAILFHIQTSISGTDWAVIWTYIKCIPNAVLVVVGTCIVLIFFAKRYNISIRKISLLALGVSIVLFIFSVHHTLTSINFYEYADNQLETSNFVEEHYADPAKVNITPPEKKQNLILVYLESIEASFSSKEEGGLLDKNHIPNLTKIAHDNLYFSNKENLGGALRLNGTGWTSAGLISTTSGINIQSPLSSTRIDEFHNYAYPHVKTLFDILHQSGYRERFVMGGNANFGGIHSYLENHGMVSLRDVSAWKEEKKISRRDSKRWGVTDNNLLEYVKQDILQNAQDTSTPFFYCFMTVDSHTPKGRITEDCVCSFDTPYANSIECADMHMGDFYTWLIKQDFFKHTTIVIMGDHLTMNNQFITQEGDRTIYNVFINSVKKTDKAKKRLFNQLDYFPTLLSCLGFSIEGDRLGLGTDLFSETPTLYETYGYVHINSELSKYSKFYNQELLR